MGQYANLRKDIKARILHLTGQERLMAIKVWNPAYANELKGTFNIIQKEIIDKLEVIFDHVKT